MKRHLLFSLFLLSTTLVIGQTKSIQATPPLSEVTPESVGMSTERLNRIDEMINVSIQKKEIPGAIALVARKGKIVYLKAFGTADASSNSAYEKDQIFRLASQTKAITCTAVMMLWEQGKFQLDDPIAKYIPEFENAQVLDTFNEADSTYTTKPATNPITIRHLLTHTSGIGYGFIDGPEFQKIYAKAGITEAWTTAPLTLQENIPKLAKLPLHFNPGERFHYSMSIDVLGYLVELISGQSLDAYFKEHIFDPLNMNDTRFYFSKSKQNRLVPVQTLHEGAYVNFEPPVSPKSDVNYPFNGAKTYFSGGGGLSGTITDYAKFLQLYLNKGEYNGVRLLSRTTVEFMDDNSTEMKNMWGDEGAHYGLAFAVTNAKGESAGKGDEGTLYWGGFWNTQYFINPDEELMGIIFKQTIGIPNDSARWKFPILVNQAVDD